MNRSKFGGGVSKKEPSIFYHFCDTLSKMLYMLERFFSQGGLGLTADPGSDLDLSRLKPCWLEHSGQNRVQFCNMDSWDWSNSISGMERKPLCLCWPVACWLQWNFCSLPFPASNARLSDAQHTPIHTRKGETSWILSILAFILIYLHVVLIIDWWKGAAVVGEFIITLSSFNSTLWKSWWY